MITGSHIKAELRQPWSKETKDKILDNQATNQKANESSKFGEHVAKEQEINAGKGTGVISNTEQAIKNVDPKSLISRQNSNEISGSDIKRYEG